jgi:hypothetical protein
MKQIVVVKVTFTGLLKARCEPELEQAYRVEAMLRKVDTADLVRYALRDYAARSLRNREIEHAQRGTF